MAAPTFVPDEIVTAAKLNSLPKGQIGYAQITAGQGSITTIVDITGLSVAVTVDTGRRIRITVFVPTTTGTVAGDRSQGLIREGSTTLAYALHRFGATAAEDGMLFTWVGTPTAGAHTYKVSFARFSGTGTVSWVGAVDAPSYILVEDIGSV